MWKRHYTFKKVVPPVHIVKLMLIFYFIVIMQHPTTQKISSHPEGDLWGTTYPKISFALMGVAIFSFFIEYVRACMLSNEKWKSLFKTCVMHCCIESWNHHHISNRKWCQYVLILLYIESIDGQFPIQTATHSFVVSMSANSCL